MKFLLSIAGFDPSGGAGVVRDICTFRKFGFHGCSVITAVISQNTKSVKKIIFSREKDILEQINLLTDEIKFSGVKIGLAHKSIKLNTHLANLLKKLNIPIVFDPVLKSTSGKTFIKSLKVISPIIDVADVITPNFEEYKSIRELLTDFKNYIIIKGIPEEKSVKDILIKNDKILKEVKHRKVSKEVRGTGCAFSSAILSKIADDIHIEKVFLESVEFIKNYRERAFKTEKMIQHISPF